MIHISRVFLMLIVLKQVNSLHNFNFNVKTASGNVIGYQYNEEIVGYTGIPYAQAPIDNLRFEPPQKLIPERNVHTSIINNKRKESVICPQINVLSRHKSELEIIGDEDCLYLNIYTPISNSDRHPVMVYIHGGAFAWGTGSIFKPDNMLRSQNVILITINYRLGPFGFLAAGYQGDKKIYANVGLKDQALALKWINENIAQFNGDRSKVTLFGNSAGAVSAHLHMFAPQSVGLFERVILQSGSALCHWALQDYEKMLQLTRELARLLDCPIGITIEMMDCLKKKSVEDILKTVRKLQIFDVDPIILFTATVEPKHDDAFLVETLQHLLENREFHDVPIMQGTTSDEGAIRTAYFAVNPDSLTKYNQQFNNLYRVSSFLPYLTNEQSQSIREFYFGHEEIYLENIKNLTNLFTDTYYMCMETSLDLHRKYSKSPLYSYLFKYKGALTFAAGDVDLGVCHMDELFYLFPLEFFDENKEVATKLKLSAVDHKMSKIMGELWTHFAHFGNFEQLEKINWLPVQDSSNKHLIFDKEFSFEMRKNRFANRQFWKRLGVFHNRNTKQVKDEL